MSMIVSPPGPSPLYSSRTFTTSALRSSPFMTTLKPRGITLFFIKNLWFHSPILAQIVMTMNESSLHSRPSPPPPSFLEPLTYEQLEAREGSLGSTYCPDLLDLVIGLFTYLGTVPPLLFGAQPDALTQTLIHGCHRPPAVTTSPLFPSTMELHESPVHFYTKIFLHSLRLPSLRSLGLPADDILALEESLKQALLSLPLPQALDVLHTQVLSCMCVSSPRRETPNTGAPPIACCLSLLKGAALPVLPLQSFAVG